MHDLDSRPRPPRRFLRVGLVHGSRLIEERLLRKPGPVSAGPGSGDTFVLPGMDRRVVLLEERGGRYALVFDATTEGRVMVGGRPRGLDELARAGGAKRHRGGFAVPLETSARGRVRVGDYTLLFQFIDAPPVLPPLRLPAAARRTSYGPRGSEWALVNALIVCGIVLGGGGASLDAWWRHTGQYLQEEYQRLPLERWLETDARVAHVEFIHAEPQPTPPVPDVEPVEVEPVDLATADEPQVAEVARHARPDANPRSKPADRAGREADSRAAPNGTTSSAKTRETVRAPDAAGLAGVERSTIIHALGSLGDESSPLGTLMQGVSTSKLTAAFNNPEVGVADATAGSVAGYRGEPAAVKRTSSDAIKRLSTAEAGGARIQTSAKAGKKAPAKAEEVAIRGDVSGGSLTGAAGVGGIDKAGVSAVFSRRRSAVRSCYDAALRKNANTSGKVTVRFTIGTAGRITSIATATNTTGDGALAACINAKVKEWKFPAPTGGPVTFSFPFVLTKS